MKLRKILALACASALALTATVISPIISANADGATVKLVAGERGALNTSGTVTGFSVDVYVTLPETFSAYTLGEDDDLNTTYSGNVLQFLNIDIPYVDGLSYLASRSSIVDSDLSTAGATINNNTSASKLQVYYNQTTASSMYAGELNHVATIVYKITDSAEVAATKDYTVALSDAYAKVYSWDGGTNATATPEEYALSSFDVTNAVSEAPTVEDPEFSATATKSATKYYTGTADDVKEVQVFDVAVENSSLAKWIFTFTSATEGSKVFNPNMSSYGDADVAFQTWIVGAPADVELTIE